MKYTAIGITHICKDCVGVTWVMVNYSKVKTSAYFLITWLLIIVSALAGWVPTPVQATNTSNTAPQGAFLLSPGDEVLSKRNENSKTWLDSGNTYRTSISMAPVHYQDGQGNWQNIDNSWWSAVAPYSWETRYDSYTTRVKNDFTAGRILQFSSQGKTVEFQPMALEWTNTLEQIQQISIPQNVIPELGNTASELLEGVPNNTGYVEWSDAYGKGRDFEWLNVPGTLVKQLTLASMPPVPPQYILDGGNPALRLNFIFDASSDLDIYVDGQLWDKKTKKQTVNIIEFRLDGQTIWGFMPALYWDSNHNQGVGATELRKVGSSLYVSVLVPYSWLQTASYPVIIDPAVSTQVGSSGDDGYRRPSGLMLTDSFAIAGNDPVGICHIFARWTGVSIEGTIVSANTSVNGEYNNGTPECLVYAVDEDNPAAPTNGTEFDADPLTSASVPWDGAWTVWGWNDSPDLSSIFQELVDSYTISNDAVMLQIRDDGSASSDRHSMHTVDGYGGAYAPMLYIRYTPGGGGPTPPTVISHAATNVEETTASVTGNITATGGENPDHRGFYYDIDSGSPYANNSIESGNFSTGSFTGNLTSLTKGELYYFIATANNSAGSGNGTELTFLTKPDEPNSLVTTANNSANISLSWSKGTGADNTVIVYKEGSYPTNTSDGTVSYNSTGTSHTITGLDPSTTYYISAWSWCTEGGLEQYSDLYDTTTGTTTGAAVSPPTVTTSAATNIEETTVTLSGNITATGGENPDHRGFYYDTDNVTPWAYSEIESGNFTIGAFSANLTSLTEGEWYQFIASANNSGGTGNGTKQYFLTKPNAPNSLTITGQKSDNISVSWNKASGADQTIIVYHTERFPQSPTDGTVSYNGTGTSVTIGSLTPGQVYNINAWSWCTEGGLEQYSDLSDNVTDYTLPGNPASLSTANITPTSIDLEWTAGIGGDKSRLQSKTGSYPTSETDGTQVYFNTSNSTSDTGLSKNITYYYRVWAYDSTSGYYSDGYSQATATTNSTAPTVTNDSGATSITNITATLRGEVTDTGGLSTEVLIYWGDNDAADNATAWDNSENLSTQSSTFSKSISSLNASVTYFYRCYAVNIDGNDWADTTANFTTLSGYLLAPTNFTASVINDFQVALTWTPGAQSTQTLIMAKYGEPPQNRNDGYQVYLGDDTSYTDRLVDLSLRSDNIFYRAWGENSGTYSSDHADTDAGGTGMLLLTQVIMIIGFAFLALHFKKFAIELIAGIVIFFIGLNWFDTYAATDSTMTGLAYGCMGLGAFLFFYMIWRAFSRIWKEAG